MTDLSIPIIAFWELVDSTRNLMLANVHVQVEVANRRKNGKNSCVYPTLHSYFFNYQ